MRERRNARDDAMRWHDRHGFVGLEAAHASVLDPLSALMLQEEGEDGFVPAFRERDAFLSLRPFEPFRA